MTYEYLTKELIDLNWNLEFINSIITLIDQNGDNTIKDV